MVMDSINIRAKYYTIYNFQVYSLHKFYIILWKQKAKTLDLLQKEKIFNIIGNRNELNKISKFVTL